MRAVIDTNVWVSAILVPDGQAARALRSFRDGRFELVLSQPLLEELAATLARFAFDQAAVVDLLELLVERGDVVALAAAGPDEAAMDAVLEEGSLAILTGDRRLLADQILIETALQGGAMAIVTGDRRLLVDQDLRARLARGSVRLLTI
jgi:putative PIN family toxin of toxin-antitoxin system